MNTLSILVVDDSATIGGIVPHDLRSHQTACVPTGADAVAALSVLRFDVVVLAVGRRGLNERNIIRHVRRTQPWARIVATTRETLPASPLEYAARARRLGVEEFAPAPLNEDRLRLAAVGAAGSCEPQLN